MHKALEKQISDIGERIAKASISGNYGERIAKASISGNYGERIANRFRKEQERRFYIK